MIGGLQMFDVPTFIAGDAGYPQGKMQTLVMVIQTGKDSSVGLVGAISVMIFIITAILGFLTLKVMNDDGSGKKKKKKPAKG
jgi:ABC-type sugar transport system permease subunit